MRRQNISFTVGAYPWIEATDTDLAPSVLYRSYLVLPYELTSEVMCDDTKDPLPFVGQWLDSKGNRWSKYELPRGESSDSISLVRFGNENGALPPISVSLGAGIARSTLDEALDEVDSPKDTLKFYGELRNFIDQHIQFMNDLNDFQRPNRLYWEGNCGDVQFRSVHRSVLRWSKSESKDNAKLALIVKLAREIAKPLGQICESPRVVLRRTREMQNIGRIQEIDPACLRWIARQPGRDIYERAGTRQELLGVVRKEDSDTLENRVVRDLLHRARIECSNYTSIYRDFADYERVRTVAGFRRRIIDWEKNSEIRNAKSLVGHVQPNYVLLHEPKYRKLWDAYQALLSQQKQKDDIWKWRDRTFSESCHCLVMSLIHGLTRRSMLHKSDLLLKQEAITGRFISKGTEYGPLTYQGSHKQRMLLLCSGTSANQRTFFPRGFLPLGTDFFIVAPQQNVPTTIFPFWCFSEIDDKTFESGVMLLEKKLAAISNSEYVYPTIFIFERPELEKKFFQGRGRIVSVGVPVQTTLERYREHFLDLLQGI
jgi:hypothetical protein